jgi:hypothetical protein
MSTPQQKTCTKCRETKPVEGFSPSKTGRLGRTSICKPCNSARQKEWRSTNGQYDIEWRSRNRERLRQYKKSWVQKGGVNSKGRETIRQEILEAYGHRCTCCGESRQEFLAIDHIFNDGAEHRKQVGSSKTFYYWLKRNGFPKDRFQLLCHNCNLAKGFYGECPHVKEMRRVA